MMYMRYTMKLKETGKAEEGKVERRRNKAGYTATKVACGWAGAIFEVTRPFGQEQSGQKPQKPKKSKV